MTQEQHTVTVECTDGQHSRCEHGPISTIAGDHYCQCSCHNAPFDEEKMERAMSLLKRQRYGIVAQFIERQLTEE